MLLLLAAILGVCLRRKRRVVTTQIHLPPQPLPSQEVLEYQKVQPMSPMFSPTTPNLPYNAPTSPGPQFGGPPGPNPQFQPPTSPGPQYNNQNPQYNAPSGPNLYNTPTGGNPPFPTSPVPSPPPFNSSYYVSSIVSCRAS